MRPKIFLGLGVALLTSVMYGGEGSARAWVGQRWVNFLFDLARTEAQQREPIERELPPPVPEGLHIAGRNGDRLQLQWQAVSVAPDREEPHYEVLRNGEVVSSVTEPAAEVRFHPVGGDWEHFAVRSVLESGRSSAPSDWVVAPRGETIPVDLESAIVYGYRIKRGFPGLRDPETIFSEATYRGRIVIQQRDLTGGPGSTTYGRAGRTEANYAYAASVDEKGTIHVTGAGTIVREGYFDGIHVDREVTEFSTPQEPVGEDGVAVPFAWLAPGRLQTEYRGEADGNQHLLLERDSRDADGFGIYRQEELEYAAEYESGLLDAGVQRDLEEAKLALEDLDWGEGLGISFGEPTFAGPFGAGVAARESSTGEPHRRQYLVAGRYRFRVRTKLPSPPPDGPLPPELPFIPEIEGAPGDSTGSIGSEVLLRWVDRFVPADGSAPRVLATHAERVDASEEDAFTTSHYLEAPDEPGYIEPVLLPVIGDWQAWEDSEPAGDVRYPGAIPVGGVVDLELFATARGGSPGLQAEVMRVRFSGPDAGLVLLLLDRAIEREQGRAAALSVAREVSPGANLAEYLRVNGTAPSRAVMVSRIPGRYAINVEFDDDPDARISRELIVGASIALVADRDRDGRIGPEDRGQDEPIRFWINDDADAADGGGSDVSQPSGYGNAWDGVVNGERDWIDFLPVWLDLKPVLDLFPPEDDLRVRLSQADGALNFLPTQLTPDEAGKFWRAAPEEVLGSFGNVSDGTAEVRPITAAGTELLDSFVEALRTGNHGLILIEGERPTTAPLVASIVRNGRVIEEVRMPMRFSPVEQMYRHVDLTAMATDYDGSPRGVPVDPAPEWTNDPGVSWPDRLSKDRYVVFIHGFNVDGEAARGWNSEIFKRLTVMGSRARFVGVTWHGATGQRLGGSYVDYHAAVFNAFEAGDALGPALAFTAGAPVTLVAHSLGNVVASEAIESGGVAPEHYFMINAAVPMEAYAAAEISPEERADMVEARWGGYAPRLRAERWHTLFPATDARSQLTWADRFERVRSQVDAYNFYSSGEDVVANEPGLHTASTLALLLRQGFDFSRGAWKRQELVKGVDWTASLAGLLLDRGQAGWEFGSEWKIRTVGGRSEGLQWRVRTPAEAEAIPSTDLREAPFFAGFQEEGLTSPDAGQASEIATRSRVQFDLLARGIPATSYAAGANPITAFAGRNFDMQAAIDSEGIILPREDDRWRHSDFKQLALRYAWPAFESLIAAGDLK